MYETDASDWRADAKWLSGILLVLVLAAAVPLFSFSQLSERQRAVPILESVLRLTLVPPGSDGTVASVREELNYEPGGSLELLPGSEVRVPATELPNLTAESAIDRIAVELTDRVITSGASAGIPEGGAGELRRQIREALEGPGARLVRAALLAQMMPSGLDRGSRVANWPLQAQRNPGEPVQPIVGVFVRLPASELQGLNPRQIGERVVVELADVLLAQGIDEARALVSNPNLLQRLNDAAAGQASSSLEELYQALLLAWQGSIADRIERALTLEQARSEGSESLASAIVTGEELSGLSREEANQLVLRRLAERAHASGSGSVLEAIGETDQAERVAAASGFIDALSARAHGDYLRLTWILAVLALLLLVLLSLLSRGWGRMANPGLAFIVAAAGGALLSVRLSELVAAPGSGALPASLRSQGVFGHLVQLLGYVGANLPTDSLGLLVRNHLILLGLGVTLVVLSLLIRLIKRARPRRRSLI